MAGNLLTILRVVWNRRALERSCGWTRTELRERQSAAVADLRRFARERSPFYRQFHKGLDEAPLADLPVLSKRTLMENFDDLVTDRAVRRRDAETFLASAPGAKLFRGRYVVLSTSGSTGFRGLFLFDRQEWLTALAGITRPMLWAGAAPNPFKPSRMAMIASTTASHYSSRVGLSLASRFLPTLRIWSRKIATSADRGRMRDRPEAPLRGRSDHRNRAGEGPADPAVSPDTAADPV